MQLGESGLTSLDPNGVDLLFYLFNFFLVSSSFVVRDLCFEFGDLLGVLPVKRQKAKTAG